MTWSSCWTQLIERDAVGKQNHGSFFDCILRQDSEMHFCTSTLAALIAISQNIGMANALYYSIDMPRPICNDIDGQNLVDFSNLQCGTSEAALTACNNMCYSQSQGCQWGGEMHIQSASNCSSLTAVLVCFNKIAFSRAICATAANNGYEGMSSRSLRINAHAVRIDPTQDFTCGQQGSGFHPCLYCNQVYSP